MTIDNLSEEVRNWMAEKAAAGALKTGLQVLDLAQRAHELNLEQDAGSRRRPLGFILSGCTGVRSWTSSEAESGR